MLAFNIFKRWRYSYNAFFQRHPVLKWMLRSAFLLIVTSFVLAEILVLSRFSEEDDVTVDAHYIIILGSGLKGAQLTDTLRMRLDEGLSYWQQHRDRKIIVSGGQGKDEDVPEAVAMRDYLLQQGIPENAILLERRSTSTYENLLFSKQVIDQDGYHAEHDAAVIVTSNYHMYRACWIGKQLGYDPVYARTSKVPWKDLPYNMLREYPALIKALLMTS
ncbi:YdcF family protein [Paenibacillus sp. WLX1005]|uniref:YdcF family protein n=1 Tax=Paenibacillus sp. WLX1005 TaxID=3243766 RepID=UPI0039843212